MQDDQAPWETKELDTAPADDSRPPAARMMTLFEGFATAHGTYDSAVSNEEKGGKLEIRATARTVRQPVTREVWEQHLAGRRPLGVIPIRDNDTCLWGAIDIDRYDISLADIQAKVQKSGLPLLVARTKSGGAHLYLFFHEPVSAAVLRSRLHEIAASLGFGGSEIFPKQNNISDRLERGDLGSWLNMPYYEGDETTRYAVKSGGLQMLLSEFLRLAESLRQSADFLEHSRRKRPAGDPEFGDGPPCMQHLAAEGFGSDGRKRGLFQFAIFAKKKYGTRWEETVEDWNRRYFDPPLPASEVVSIIKSVGSKDYNYPCREFPIAAHCNSSLCRTRRFGVGGSDDFPVVANMRILDSDPPVWFLDVNGDQLEFTSEQLQDYRKFHLVVMERTHTCFRMMKNTDWLAILAEAMRNATKIDVPDEVGIEGQFRELVHEFLTNRHRGEKMEDLLSGLPYEEVETGKYWFRLADLDSFLKRREFRKYNRGQMSARIRALGGDREFRNISRHGRSIWCLPVAEFPRDDAAQLPRLEQEAI